MAYSEIWRTAGLLALCAGCDASTLAGEDVTTNATYATDGEATGRTCQTNGDVNVAGCDAGNDGGEDRPSTSTIGQPFSDAGAEAQTAVTGMRDSGMDSALYPDAGLDTSGLDASRIDASTSGNSPMTSDAEVQPAHDKTCLKGSGDFTGNGPYQVRRQDVMVEPHGAYTIFYPDPLESDCPHPIVAWGNGTFVTGADLYAFYQEHAASWGIVVIASHNDQVGSGDFHRAGLDYLLAENQKPGSEFFQKLSTKAGVSGHSQGGEGANQAATHPNVEAEVNVQGAVFGLAPADTAFLCLTGTADIDPVACGTAVRGTTSPAFVASWEGGDHTATATLLGYLLEDPGTTQYLRLHTAWFRCFLASDDDACAMFRGGDACSLCSEPGWAEIFANNM